MSTILRRTSLQCTAGWLLVTLLLGCAGPPPQVVEVTRRMLSADQPLDGPLLLVAGGDKRQRRWLRQVSRIAVRSALEKTGPGGK